MWKLQREMADGRKVTCEWHQEATATEPGRCATRFAVEAGPPASPSLAVIAQRFGRGAYYALFFGPGNRSLGPSGRINLDDPNLPELGTYPNDPNRAAKAAAEAAAAAASAPAPTAVVERPPEGYISLAALALADARAQGQWEGVVARIQAAAATDIARLEVASNERIASMNAMWSAQLAQMQQIHKASAAAPAPDPAVTTLLAKWEELQDELEEAREEKKAGESPNVLAYIQQGAALVQQPGIQRVLLAAADAIVKNFGSGSTPAGA